MEGTSDAFVRDVKAAPNPQCVLFFDWQLNDLVRFLTDSRQFSVLTADTTYNLGQFYVTPTTYRHLMLVNITSQKHPTMAGPILVHQRKDFASFSYFANTMIGTDGDQALIEAFAHNFPFAKQLRCFIHMKKNISTKLKDNGIPSVSQEFVSGSVLTNLQVKCHSLTTLISYPPDIFTTNASESLNAALKKKVNYKETEWPEINQAMKQFVLAQ